MDSNTRLAILVVAGLHVLFAAAEILLWETLTPKLRIFDPERAKATSTVGRNMGVYNGILAAVLFWLLSSSTLDPTGTRSLSTVLLSSAIVAGIFGGVTIKWTIVLFQSLPALIALVMLWRS